MATANGYTPWRKKLDQQDYSDIESEAGYTWFGQKVYKKSFNISSTATFSHNISNLSSVVDIKGTIYRGGSQWTQFGWNNTFNSQNYFMVPVITATQIIFNLGPGTISPLTGTITLFYTKTS